LSLRLNHRLFAGFFGIVALMAALTVGWGGAGLSRELKENFRSELGRQLALGEWIVAHADGAGPDSLARIITSRVGYRATLIDTAGVVLGDSYLDPARVPRMENHAGRPEVRAALAGRVTFNERISATLGDRLLYGARLVDFGGEPLVLRLAAPLVEIERAVSRVRRAVALSGFLAMLVALGIAFFASRALNRPLLSLAEQARRLTAGDSSGRFARRTGIPELDDLSLAFNRLTEELQARLSDLSRERDEMHALIDCMAEGVVALTADARVLRANQAARALLDLPDPPTLAPIGSLVRHREMRELLEVSVADGFMAREVRIGDRSLLVSSRTLDSGGAVTTFLDVSELRRLEQVRTDFVANASHELKTPLTSVRGFAETLLDGDPPPEVRQRFLSSIHENTLRMQRLVDDLLDLSRLEAGSWGARSQPVGVADAARAAWAGQSAAARGDIRFDVEAEHVVLADPQGLDQILRNLLENALRHTDPGGRIWVSSSVGEREIRVEVSDDGEGIPARSLPRVFERFYRTDGSRARDSGGTGLGLAIVRHLVEAMGGDVGAHSELGKGTTIWFTLPAA